MKVAIVKNTENKHASLAAKTLADYFTGRQIDFDLYESRVLFDDDKVVATAAKAAYGICVVLGGDGTILRCARLLAGTATPILGINFGHLGFLANSADAGVLQLVDRALAGNLKEEKRTTLSIEVETDEASAPPGGDMGLGDGKARDSISGIPSATAGGITHAVPIRKNTYFALNEIAVCRMVIGRAPEWSVSVSGVDMFRMRADGVIVSTATGSTGYSLSAGGPIVTPTFDGMIVTPLAAHSLGSRGIVIDGSDTVRISVDDALSSGGVTLLADGNVILVPAPVCGVKVRRGDKPITLLYDNPKQFLDFAAKTFFNTPALAAVSEDGPYS